MGEGLAEMFEYNRWANRALIEACRAVPGEHLDARVPGVSGTVRSLLSHVVGGQQTFLLRTVGRQHEGEFGRSSPFPGFDALLEAAEASGAALIETARNLDEAATVDLPWMGKVYRFPVRFFLTHALEHGVEHRTEVKVALGSLGIETPDLDAWSYSGARGYGEEV